MITKTQLEKIGDLIRPKLLVSEVPYTGELAQQILDICQPQWIHVSERRPDIKPHRNIDIAYHDATDGIFTAKVSSRLIPNLAFYAWREAMEPFQPPPPPEDTA